ncbi:hypothetical protein IQ266_22165 [filamentous cyanobacterium LEGE 11480]|uniref:Uncharacterized protein n=1 Tax=Romeriopsis navalis LEGE 11480 TaxID=2777977 RepID=A0A928Z5X6_9CYAN|nr:hypothetical protein [Romeriopsis navalis]MBE9032447.1 hypothetical protein [Romeriopsis navalis LEGE 11480]
MTNLIRPPAELSEQSSILAKDNRGLMLYHIALPGALGGIAKVTWDGMNPPEIPFDAKLSDTQPSSLGALPRIAPSPFVTVPGSIFLGVISALIGILVLSDMVDLKKAQLKIFGLSLVFGLFFPSVFELAGKTISLQNQNDQAQAAVEQAQAEVEQAQKTTIDQVTQVTKIADTSQNSGTKVRNAGVNSIEELAEKTDNQQVKQKAIESIGQLAKESKDPEVEQNAIRSLQSISSDVPIGDAGGTKIIETQSKAIKQIDVLVSSSNNPKTQQDATAALGNIAEEAKDPKVKQQAEKVKGQAEEKLKELNK